ncbi:MAG: hypothetical protein RKK15_09755 [Defluviicoccus sp.]|nr:hypothetical protein [Defluviicoccus sp.]
MSKSVVFGLDARAQYTEPERALIKKYKLGSVIIYESETAKKHGDAIRGHQRGMLGTLASMAMHGLSLHITVDSLAQGHHLELKDMNELLAAEEALAEACRTSKVYLETAETFDGREVVLDF